ncbi:MAG: DUF3568 family protein [Candidatus Omnitrophica bacterium]|nr:DUF3568 family protein [Candidatus Omnitrophota bacterium]
MAKNAIILSLILVLSLATTGCALFLIGAGAAGGIAISKDSAELNLDKPYAEVYEATVDVLDEMGAVKLQDIKAGRVEASVQGSSVTAKVKRITEKTTGITVSARKNLLPNVDMAVNVLNNVNNKFQ